MTSMLRLLALAFAFPLLALAAAPSSPEELAAALRAASSAGDSAQIDALTYQAGMSDSDRETMAKVNRMITGTGVEIQEVLIKPLPENFADVAIVRGKRIEMTGPPAGLIELKAKSGPNGTQTSSIPFTRIGDGYYLVGSKSTDLGWKGPPDKNIGFMVMGKGQDQVKIHVKWNASGVDQSRDFSHPSTTFWDQQIDSVKVTSDSEESDVVLVILENGQQIYSSEPLKGRGILEYQRPR